MLPELCDSLRVTEDASGGDEPTLRDVMRAVVDLTRRLEDVEQRVVVVAGARRVAYVAGGLVAGAVAEALRSHGMVDAARAVADALGGG